METRSISFFHLQQVVLYFKDMPNLTNFYKGNLLHVILIHIKVSWLTELHDWTLRFFISVGSTSYEHDKFVFPSYIRFCFL